MIVDTLEGPVLVAAMRPLNEDEYLTIILLSGPRAGTVIDVRGHAGLVLVSALKGAVDDPVERAMFGDRVMDLVADCPALTHTENA